MFANDLYKIKFVVFNENIPCKNFTLFLTRIFLKRKNQIVPIYYLNFNITLK